MSNPEMRPIPGFEEHYAVTMDGRVFSLNYRRTGKVVELAQSSRFDKRRSSESMYRQVKAYHINPATPTAVHRLVALAFVPNPHGLPMVNHIDGNKANNQASNLEWVDNSGNQRHASMSGLRTYQHGEDHHMAILTEGQVREIRERLQHPYRGQLTDLGVEFGVSIHCIFDIKHGRAWKEVA